MNNEIIGVIGSGAMGSGIAQAAATAGHKVIVFDNNIQALENSKSNLSSYLAKLVEKQKLSLDESNNIFSNIKIESNILKLNHCNLIIEAISENLESKQKLFFDLERVVGDSCLLASNTSSLSITSIASACINQARVIGLHFFNPVSLMPLVEIIPGIATGVKRIDEVKAMIINWKKVPVIAKDTPGFIVNRIARPFYGEAIRIYEEGIADFSTIDWAVKEMGGFKMGPFELMDMIGNDINYTVTEAIWEQFFFDPRYKPSLTQKRLFEAKHFGRKSGRGYYDYLPAGPAGSSSLMIPAPNKDESRGKKIFYRILIMLINEASDALYYGVATKEDIDLAMTKGVNYPKGLFKWADEIGVPSVLSKLEKLYTKYAEDRYRPSVLLKKMTKEGKTFY